MAVSKNRVIIAGSRSIDSYELVWQVCRASGFQIWEIVSGGARGVDRLGERYGKDYGMPVKQFLPDWDKHGKRAGFLRNEEMANYADGLIAIWDGESRGTAHMIKTMEALGKPVFVYKTAISEGKGAEAPTMGEGHDS